MGTAVAVQTYEGEGAYGKVLAASANKVCGLQTTRKLVRNADGEEVVSEFTLQASPDDAAAFTPRSEVTVAGRTSTVLATSPKTYRGRTAWVEVSCS